MTRCRPKVRASHGATYPNAAKHSTGSVVSSPAVWTPCRVRCGLVEHRTDAHRRRTEVERQHDEPEHDEGTLDDGTRRVIVRPRPWRVESGRSTDGAVRRAVAATWRCSRRSTPAPQQHEDHDREHAP